MTDLCGKYLTFLEQEGVREPRCRSYVLKERLVAHFGDRLCFHRPQGGTNRNLSLVLMHLEVL